MKEVTMSVSSRLFLVLLLSPFCWGQQPPSNLKARTLFYRENPDSDRPTPASTTKPRKDKKTDVSKGAAAPGTAATPGSTGSEPNNTNAGVPNGPGVGDTEAKDSRSPATPEVQNLGLRYNLVLVDHATNEIKEAVSPAHNFQEDDCVAIELQPNRSGYLYVLEQGSSGRWISLFPSSDLPDEPNNVAAWVVRRMPQGGFLRIKPPKGEERVFVILTRNPENVDELRESIRNENGGAPSSLLAENVNRRSKETEKRLQSRDLEIDTVDQPQSAAERPYSVYVTNVSNVASDELSVEIQIKHN
jgi:hypothetical protein